MTRCFLRKSGMMLAAIVICSLPLVPVTADALGDARLFLTAAQRATLDNARANPKKPEPPEPPKPVEKPKPVVKKVVKRKVEKKPSPVLPEVTLQGFVQRSGGESTVWVNNRASKEGDVVGKQVQLLSMDGDDGDVTIKMPDQSRIKLKPGQEFQPKGRKIVDLTE